AFATVIGNLVAAVWTWRRVAAMLGWVTRDIIAALAPVVAATLTSGGVGLALHGWATTPWTSAIACAGCAGGGLLASIAASRVLAHRAPAVVTAPALVRLAA
ncbi:MAG: hypothetical protein NT062_38135, partial [Proteobacteria bacterium]|nr:hypothetical protein [Pseudomonadota bacterium]